MNPLAWSAITWQSIAMGLAALLAIVSGVAAVKATLEQDAQGEDIKGWLTGGDSYPYLEPLAFPEGIKYLIKHAGNKYPIYDVQVGCKTLIVAHECQTARCCRQSFSRPGR
jgi:hypothetical protein